MERQRSIAGKSSSQEVLAASQQQKERPQRAHKLHDQLIGWLLPGQLRTRTLVHVKGGVNFVARFNAAVVVVVAAALTTSLGHDPVKAAKNHRATNTADEPQLDWRIVFAEELIDFPSH